jgi:hypothetical protein
VGPEVGEIVGSGVAVGIGVPVGGGDGLTSDAESGLTTAVAVFVGEDVGAISAIVATAPADISRPSLKA